MADASSGPSPITTISISFEGLPRSKSRTNPPITYASILFSAIYCEITLKTGCFKLEA